MSEKFQLADASPLDRRSCSLACTQSHKIYCAPKANANEPNEAPVANQPTNGETLQEAVIEDTSQKSSIAAIGGSTEIQELLRRYPQFREQLYETYLATKEEEWVEWYTKPARGRSFGRGGKAPTRRSRGQWTTEKGFNRGLGKVRKLRKDCEEGTETGRTAEAFMQFLKLVNQSSATQPPEAT
ncbi:hypothetical protein N7470_008191 [Penicillium chermesinum]|nr:hypothetical protein N7470_008191 [Penicillium chermesinum]